MRILHTADWHLNDRLGRIDRTDDLRRAVERVAGQCREHRVDVLLVAGDLFSELARPDALRESIRHWQDVFAEFLAGGGTIVTLTGNHDNENFCQTLRHAMTLAAPTVERIGEVVPPGRLYLAADPTLLRLRDPSDKFDVQFALMPYPTPAHYLRGESSQKYTSSEEKNRLLIAAFDERLAELRSHPKFDAKLPAILSGHVHLYGANVGPSLFRLTDQEDMLVQGDTLADAFAYVALGHIHKPQCVNHREHVRYSGSIEKMDLGEQNDSKGTVLFEIGPRGRVGEIVTLPLPSTPVYELMVVDPEVDIPRLRQEYADAANDLVNLHIRYTAGKDNLEEVLHDLEKIFPRWYARDWTETAQLLPGSLVVGDADRSLGFAETVREYLSQELLQHSEADREELLKLAEDLLQEMP